MWKGRPDWTFAAATVVVLGLILYPAFTLHRRAVTADAGVDGARSNNLSGAGSTHAGSFSADSHASPQSVGRADLKVHVATTTLQADIDYTQRNRSSGILSIRVAKRPSRDAANKTLHWFDLEPGRRMAFREADFDSAHLRLVTDSRPIAPIPLFDSNGAVIKFAKSPDESAYLANESGGPVLYLPGEWPLIHAAADGARWTPVGSASSIDHPVYLRPLPTWTDLALIPWYPGMTIEGGQASDAAADADFFWLPGYSIRIPSDVAGMPGQQTFSDFRAFTAFAARHPLVTGNGLPSQAVDAPRQAAPSPRQSATAWPAKRQ